MSDGSDPANGPTAELSERWRQLEELFDAASDLPAAERAAYLERVCPDAELREEVAVLLANADHAGSLRDRVAAELEHIASALPANQVGRRLGPYKLIELLGEGGMGVVYLATRDDQEYRREVAIKILQHAFPSADAIARFRDERQLLATLEHPGIVRLLDGDSTEDGLPFLVLERVEGVPLTHHAAEHRLSVRAKVELVLRVCAALQYAHGKLVVHRDIKPSNILVDASGEPKLLDFGIAKLLDPEADAEREAHTRTGMALLTPEYASPEQARREQVTVAVDVYGLGAVFYELVTGRPPHSPTSDPREMLRRICEVDPPRASVAAPELARELAGDLDNIIAKALHKEPSQRYASIEQLADDLRRYLEGLPVVARAATLGYRAGKFARRNRGKLAIAVAVVIALATATAISIRQAQRADAAANRARQRYEDVRLLANSLLFEIDESIRDVAGTTRARELVVERALTNLERLAREPDRDPALNRELAIAYMKIGDIQGSPYEPSLGNPRDGLQSYHKAVELLAGLDDRADPRVTAARITAAFGIGFMHHASRDIAAAHKSLTGALDDARQAPAGVEVDGVMQARAYGALAFNAKEANDIVESARWATAGLELIGHWDARTPEASYFRAYFMLRQADTVARAGDPDLAADALRERVEIHASLAAEHPDEWKYQREQAFALLQLGVVLGGVGDARLWVADTGALAAAEDALRRAVEIFERHVADDPRDERAKMEFAILQTSLGLTVAKRSIREALPRFTEALTTWDLVPSNTRKASYVRENEFILHCAMAHALAAAGKRDDARRRAKHGRQLAGGNEFNVAMCRALVARMHRALGEPDQAVANLEAVADTLRLRADEPDISALVGLVETLEQLAQLRPAEACRFYREAAGHWHARRATTDYLRRRGEELAAMAETRCAGKL
jgi:hypothetical protein